MLEDSNNDWQIIVSNFAVIGIKTDITEKLVLPTFEECEKFIKLLFENIWYQGALYEKSTLMVPLLIELVANDAIPCKKQLLQELADLAMRCSPHDLHVSGEEHDEDPWPERSKPPQDYLQQQRIWVQQVYDAIAGGLDVYLALLVSHDPEIRMVVPVLLSVLEEYAETILPQVRSCVLKAQEPEVKASLVGYFGAQMTRFPEDEFLLRTIVQTQSEHPLVRIVAAFSQVVYTRQETSAETREVLLEGLLPSQELEAMYALLPWSSTWGHSLMAAVSTFLPVLGLDHADALIPRLLEALSHLDQSFQQSGHIKDPALDPLVEALLSFAFGGQGLSIRAIPLLLTKTQRAVLVALVKSPVVMQRNQRFAERMDELGFPFLWKLRQLLIEDVDVARI